jgi:alpha-tubulin suppressor-like RCC1 family protein
VFVAEALSPSLPEIVEDVAAVACGLKHFLAVTSEGTLLAWGDNSQGLFFAPHPRESALFRLCPLTVHTVRRALGIESVDSSSVPRSVHLLGARTASFSYVSLLIRCPVCCATTVPPTANQCLPSPAAAKHHELKSYSVLPQVACGDSHSLAVTQDGTVWAWGTGFDGRLGHGMEVSELPWPTRITALEGGCSNVFASATCSAAIGNDGTL